MSDFYPISPLVGITNTSYAAQAGVMDEKWACRVVRGKKILVEKTLMDLDLEAFVGVIYGHIRVEGLSRHAVAVCAGRLMQFSRKYQTAGIAPNFEVPDLHYEDGTSPISTGSEDAESTSEVPLPPEGIEAEEITVTPVGALPELTPSKGFDLWESTIDAFGVMIAEMAVYGSELSGGHLRLMFDRVADELIRLWSASGEGIDVLSNFGNHILSCSKEGQLPATGKHKLTIETGACRLLAMARDLDPDGERIPAGFPCSFHEQLGKKVSDFTGANIEVNTSSTGCRIQFSLDLG
ncbi:MAG: hypothetical protein ACFFAY_09625 [Promethearchaeota archaeon]